MEDGDFASLVPEECKRVATIERLREYLSSAEVVALIEGTPENPGKESVQLLQTLNEKKVKHLALSLRDSEELTAFLKEQGVEKPFSHVFHRGERIGGVESVLKAIEEGAITPDPAAGKTPLEQRLESLINQKRVMLFMKGKPEAPECGFSAKTVEVLKQYESLGLDYGHFNIYSDEEVRQGLKAYSNWPTFPQLYVDGKLVGGIDIIAELHEEDELSATLGLQ